MSLSFTRKDWKSFPDTSTPVNQAALEDLETRVTDFATLTAVYEAKAHGPVLNVVTDYGADNTGATNAHTAINNAIAAVGSGGGVVYIPDGTYLIGAVISIPSNVTLLGRVQSVLKASVALGATSWIRNTGQNVSANNNITLRNLIIDGNITQRAAAVGDPGASANLGFHGADGSTPCSNISVIGCEFRNFPGICISFRDCKGIRMQDCWIHDGTRDGIHLSRNVHDGHIRGNYIINVGDDHIAVHGGSGATNLSSGIVVSNNVCDTTTRDSYGQILFTSVQDCVAVGNTCTNSWQASISVQCDEGRPCKNVAIVGNTITNAGQGTAASRGDGIYINNGDTNTYTDDVTIAQKGIVEQVTVIGNVITNSKRNAITVYGQNATSPVRDLNISNNVVDAAVVGIWLNGTVNDTVVNGNRVAATTAFKWPTAGAGNLVMGNAFGASGTGFAAGTAFGKKHANYLPGPTFEHGDTT